MRSLGSYWRELRDKMVGDPLPTERVAAGWALGMFIGCSVPFGLQLIVSVPLAILMRVSKVGATVGTLITNPVTIFLIYPAQTWMGCRLMGLRLSWAYVMDVGERIQSISLLTMEGWRGLVQLFSDLGAPVLFGYFLGGIVLALIFTPITYFIVRHIVCTYRMLRGGSK